MTFSYQKTPDLLPSETRGTDLNVSYVDSVRYTSNDNTGYQGRWLVKFLYRKREDIIVGVDAASRTVRGHILARIKLQILDESGQKSQTFRAYDLDYRISPSTADSCLTQIVEVGSDGGRLTPTVFSYSDGFASLSNADLLFKSDKSAVVTLPGSQRTIALLPVNVTGRTYCDIVAIQYDDRSNSMQLKTWLGNPRSDNPDSGVTIAWASTTMRGRSSTALLPSVPHSPGSLQPIVLCADLNGDGKTDIIMPYKTAAGMLEFSISESVGTGYKDYATVSTGTTWELEAKFLALDCDGNGHTDIVQIFRYGNCIAFRTYFSIYDYVNSAARLKKPTETFTTIPWTETKDWLVSDLENTGIQGLVRIYPEQNGNDLQLRALAFRPTLDPARLGTFEHGKSVILDTLTHKEAQNLTVVPCDINGDGVQDCKSSTLSHSLA